MEGINKPQIITFFYIYFLLFRFLDNIDIFINNDDCIPRMSLGSIAKLIRMVRAIDELDLTAKDHLQLIFQPNSTPEIIENQEKINTVLTAIKQDTFRYLEHPGKIHYLKRIESDQINLLSLPQQQSETICRDIFLLERMVYDHLSPDYLNAMKTCKKK